MSFFLQLLFSGVVLGLVYALAALGFVLIYKASRVVNFAQGQFIAIGAFLAYWAMVALGAPFLLAAALALALTALLGFGVERVFLKRMVGQPIISVIMATIGLASLLDGLIHLTPFGAGNFSYPAFLPSGGVALLGVQVSYPQLLALGFTLAFLALFTWFFQRSTLGIAMRSVADDQMAAMSLGVSVEKVFALAWAAAGLTAAAAGIVVGTIAGLNLDGLVHIGLKVFPVVILGAGLHPRGGGGGDSHRRLGKPGGGLPGPLCPRRGHPGRLPLPGPPFGSLVQAPWPLRHGGD